jgi:uncharacterized protein (DUF111 family)
MTEASDRSPVTENTTDGVDAGWKETPGRLILTQADHLSGEELGGFIEALQEAGVGSLQVSPTVTKKNRPGQIILIDLGREGGTAPATDVLAAYGLSGFHLIETRHFHLPHSKTSARVVACYNGSKIKAEVGVKRLCQSNKSESIRIEYDDLKHLSRRIEQELEISIAPPDLNRQLTAQLLRGSEAVINLDRQAKNDEF